MWNYFWQFFGFISIGIVLRFAYVVFENYAAIKANLFDWTYVVFQAALAIVTGAVVSLIIALAVDNTVVLAIALTVLGFLSYFLVQRLMKAKGNNHN